MLVKIFRNKGAGSARASTDYLLGQDRERPGAQIIAGDPDLTAQLADSLDFKNRYTVGCMSFEEQASSFTHDQKLELIDRFENTLFAGMDRSQYSIAWVEHSDKGGRLELNFLVANVELSTEKRLQPYYDKVDRKLVDQFQTVINYEYGLSDPHDPLHRSWCDDLNVKNLSPSAKGAKQQINTYITSLVEAGEVDNRDGIVDALKQSGFEIARITDKAISLKDPDGGRNIRLTGAMYEKGTNFSGLESQARGSANTYESERERTYRRALEGLEGLIQRKERLHQEKYQRSMAVDVAPNHDWQLYDLNDRSVPSVTSHELSQMAGTRGYEERNSGTPGESKLPEMQAISGITDLRSGRWGAVHHNSEGGALHVKEWKQRYTDKVKQYAESIRNFAISCFERIRKRKQGVDLFTQTIERYSRASEKTDRGIRYLKYNIRKREQKIEFASRRVEQADRQISRFVRKDRSIEFDKKIKYKSRESYDSGMSL